jgi:UDP-N-acetylmuramoyl-tripeptide--D-alanyl-D-alanine ligase
MNEISIQKLGQIIQAERCSVENSFQKITSVSIDSRNIKPGACFFAVKGENHDGHNFVNDAFKAGAVCAVVNQSAELGGLENIPVLIVPDTIKALGEFANFYRNQQNFKTISITGSVGKTTSRNIIYQILSKRYKCHQAQKNYNNNIGLPLTILSAKEDTEILITELGSNNLGEIKTLTKIAEPDIALITEVSPSHLDGFGNLESIITEKLSIAGGLKPNGKLVINGDTPLLVKAAKREELDFTTFGFSDKNDIRVSDMKVYGCKSEFKIENTNVKIPLAGKAAVLNCLAGWSVCKILGISVKYFAEAAVELKTVEMRTDICDLGEMTLINDCYNASPASMKNALEILNKMGDGRNCRKVFICGDMAELGGQSRYWHEQVGIWSGDNGVDIFIGIGENCRFSGKEFQRRSGKNVFFFKDTKSACNNLEKIVKDTDIILVKGSRSSGLENVVVKLQDTFNNRSSRND